MSATARERPGPRLKLHRGWWYLVWTEGTGATRGTRRVSLRTQDKAEAERAARDHFASARRARAAGTVGEALDAYAADLLARGKAQSHARLVEARKALGPTFDHLQPHHVTRDLCRAYTAGRNRSPGTVRKELSILRTAVGRAYPNAGVAIDLPPAPPPRDEHITRAEYARLLEAARADHVRLFITLALGTGARHRAVLGLTWDRVDFDRGRIDLRDDIDHGKKRRAIVPMSRTVRAALEQARPAATCAHVIEHGGKPIKSARHGFANAVERAGLAGRVTPHVLRHTAAVWLIEGGRGFEEVAQFLGHTDSRTTERIYARFSPTYLQAAADLLDT